MKEQGYPLNALSVQARKRREMLLKITPAQKELCSKIVSFSRDKDKI